MVSLLTIPLELLVEVSSFLSTPDLGALRLTCKQVEKSLYEWFAKEFFTKKQFMLTHKSLQAFYDISKHVSFSKKLSHVIIATNVYVERPVGCKDSDAAALYIQGYEDQKSLLHTGVDREMLTEAFKNLKNLQTVGIRDFNNNSRSRDGINWSSWGATTVHRETGSGLQFAGNTHHTPQIAHNFLVRIFQNLIYALAKADRHPQEIEVLLRHDSLPDSAFNVPDFLHPAVDPLLRSLKKLLVNADMNFETFGVYRNGQLADRCPGRSFRRFLEYTPNLTHLRLNLPKHQFENNEQLLQWLSLPVSAPGSQIITNFFEPPPVDLAHLTALELGQFQARPHVILGAIAKFAPTLNDLSLWRMNLSDSHRVYDVKTNLWARLFAKLAHIPGLQLQHLKVGMLSQEDNNHVQFRNRDSKTSRPVKDESVPPLKVKEYTGAKMDAFIKECIEDVFVQWPRPMPAHADDDDDDEDEEMEDDDDEDHEEEGDSESDDDED